VPKLVRGSPGKSPIRLHPTDGVFLSGPTQQQEAEAALARAIELDQIEKWKAAAEL
jgi:hypothetical protein